MQMLAASLNAPKTPEGFQMTDFLGLLRLALDKVCPLPELFKSSITSDIPFEEPRFSFSYEEHLQKRSDFLSLLQSRIVFLFHELFKANEKDLLDSLVAPFRDLLLRVGYHYLRSLDPSEGYVYLKSLKLLLATESDLKERVVLLNAIVLRLLET